MWFVLTADRCTYQWLSQRVMSSFKFQVLFVTYTTIQRLYNYCSLMIYFPINHTETSCSCVIYYFKSVFIFTFANSYLACCVLTISWSCDSSKEEAGLQFPFFLSWVKPFLLIGRGLNPWWCRHEEMSYDVAYILLMLKNCIYVFILCIFGV